jgi:hypothetical protein
MNNSINFKTFLVSLGLIIFLVISSIAMNPPKEKYMVQFKHNPEDCLNTLNRINDKDAKLLDKIEWSCISGDHTGYMVVNASSEQEALRGIPDYLNAKAYKIAMFTPKKIEELHKMKK